MSSNDIPAPVRRYLDADAGDDIEVLARCFTSDARVFDEGRTIQGIDAIKAWKTQSRSRYRYRVEPLAVATEGATARLTARVSGSFPGSPVELAYRFALHDDRIAEPEIG